MKQVLLIVVLLLTGVVTKAQMISGAVDIVTIYSQNERFYLKSIPYDNESPSLRGKTSVYAAGNATPIYTLQRGFDVMQPNSLILSNDGETIFLANTYAADEATEGMKSICVYRHGQLIRSFTEAEVTGCDKEKERCDLVYNNDQTVLDIQKMFASPPPRKKIFKPEVDEKEKFLNEFPLFSFDNLVYLTDSKKKLHTFDLAESRFIRTDSFGDVFDEVKTKARLTRIERETYTPPAYRGFPNLTNGANTTTALANYLGMQTSDLEERFRFKVYTVFLTGNLARDGSLEIEEIKIDPGLPEAKILEFFRTTRFDTRPIPAVFDKWKLRNQFFSFRNKNLQQARSERQQQSKSDQQELQRRLTLEKINGRYIPADLAECFVQLDKDLKEVDKREMRALPKREDMIRYHFSLGLWIRNNWGLWGGSRLQKYFRDRGVMHPDEMSGIILDYYYDWLNDKKDTWKTWEEARKPHR